MTTTARASRYRIAYGKQSAEGTAQATPKFEVSFYDGNVIPTKEEIAHDVADTEDIPVGYWRAFAGGSGDPVLASGVESIGMHWAMHLGGDTVTGTTPKLHTIIRSYTKSFMTWYHMRPGVAGGTDLWSRMTDVFVQAVEVRGEAGMPLKHAVTLLGKTYELSVTAPTATNDERISGSSPTPLLTMIGATLKLDLGAQPASTTVHNLQNVVIRSEYPNAKFIPTDALTGQYLDFGEWNGTFSADVVVQDYNAFASTYWGQSTVPAAALPGAALSPVLVYGAIDFLFQVGPTTSANATLEIQMPRCVIEITPPAMDVGGGAQMATFTGKTYKPGGATEPITVLVTNTTASY